MEVIFIGNGGERRAVKIEEPKDKGADVEINRITMSGEAERMNRGGELGIRFTQSGIPT